MSNTTHEVDRTTRWLRLVARIWSVAAILFTLVMAIGHMFGEEPETVDYPRIEVLLPVVMFFCVMALALAWRWEAIGGAINVGLFVVHLGLFWIIRGEFFPFLAMPILLAAVVPGVLFLVCWWRTRHNSP